MVLLLPYVLRIAVGYFLYSCTRIWIMYGSEIQFLIILYIMKLKLVEAPNRKNRLFKNSKKKRWKCQTKLRW